MQTLTLNIKDSKTSEKVIWFLKHLQQDGVEIIDQEDSKDLKDLAHTRTDESIDFNEYLDNEN